MHYYKTLSISRDTIIKVEWKSDLETLYKQYNKFQQRTSEKKTFRAVYGFVVFPLREELSWCVNRFLNLWIIPL